MERVLRNKKIFNFRGSLCMPYGVFMVLFAVFPLFIVAYFAFTDVNGAFSVSQWGTVFGNSSNWKVIGTTFIISGLTTLFCWISFSKFKI